MSKLEKIFKNRITFVLHRQHNPRNFNVPTIQVYLSNNIFTPKEYNIKFVKEKVKAFAYYLFSCYVLENRKRGNQINHLDETIKIYLLDPFSDENDDSDDHILIRNLFLNQENLHPGNFFNFFDIFLNLLEEIFCCKIPLKPFKIMVEFDIYLESNLPKIHTGPSFKCVICLTNISNVLFCDCGHICICSECDTFKCLDSCPMCRIKSTIKRKIV